MKQHVGGARFPSSLTRAPRRQNFLRHQPVYHISRNIYRQISPHLESDADRAAVLSACEGTVYRLATDRFYFSTPAKTLFDEIRWRFPLASQREIFTVIDRELDAMRTQLEERIEATEEMTGAPLRCRATTRRSSPCGHEPDPRTGYCSWHRHLADPPRVAA